MKSHVIGCLLGGVLGDAWGGPFEGCSGSLRFELPPSLSISDDTQFTLATCQSIVQSRSVSPENLAFTFLQWFNAGQFRGMGSSTLKAMRDLADGAHWAVAGRRGEFAAGNGAAMRAAPLAFVLDPADPRDRVVIRDACRITHHSDEAYVGALAVIFAIHSVLTGAWSSEHTFLKCVIDHLPDSRVRDRIGDILALQLPAAEIAHRFGASGYVVESVPLALHCAQNIANDTLSSVLERAIYLGGDTDTIASITGQIAGTVAGSPGVPIEQLDRLIESEFIRSIAEEFSEFVADAAA